MFIFLNIFYTLLDIYT